MFDAALNSRRPAACVLYITFMPATVDALLVGVAIAALRHNIFLP